MVRYEQRAASLGNIFTAFHANFVEDQRQHPEQQSQQCVRQHPANVDGGPERHHRTN